MVSALASHRNGIQAQTGALEIQGLTKKAAASTYRYKVHQRHSLLSQSMNNHTGLEIWFTITIKKESAVLCIIYDTAMSGSIRTPPLHIQNHAFIQLLCFEFRKIPEKLADSHQSLYYITALFGSKQESFSDLIKDWSQCFESTHHKWV